MNPSNMAIAWAPALIRPKVRIVCYLFSFLLFIVIESIMIIAINHCHYHIILIPTILLGFH